MAGCCEFDDYEEAFGSRYAVQLAHKYRKRGLDSTARTMVDWLAGQGIQDATVLEIGGGVGTMHIELLRRGAASATNLELSATYDEPAWRLANNLGVADRIERRRLDLAADPGSIGIHDVVVLHRVVCCYPDAARLLAAAAARADRLLVFSYPPDNPLHRTLARAENAWQRTARKSFRTYVHDPGSMVGAASSSGLVPAYRRRGLVWNVAGFCVPAC